MVFYTFGLGERLLRAREPTLAPGTPSPLPIVFAAGALLMPLQPNETDDSGFGTYDRKWPLNDEQIPTILSRRTRSRTTRVSRTGGPA